MASTTREVTEFTATAGQTSFTITYPIGYIDVYRNGSKILGSDLTATSGTSFTISACTAGDIVQAIVYTTLSFGSIGPTGPSGSGPTGPTGPTGAASSVAGPTGPTGEIGRAHV